MKKTGLLVFCLLSTMILQAQLLKKISDRAKTRAETKTNEKIENKTDAAVDTAFNKVGQGIKDITHGSSEGDAVTDTSHTQEKTTVTAVIPSVLKSYSKYDFVPGEKIMAYEDFMQDAVGDLPARWNTNSAGEVVTIEGKPGHWFKLTQKGIFLPEFIDSLGDNFTLEFDLLCDQLVGSWGLRTDFVEMADRLRLESWGDTRNYVEFHILPGGDGNGMTQIEKKKGGAFDDPNSNPTKQFADVTKTVHVAIWRQKERIRLYLNEEKTWDIPRAIAADAKLNTLLFRVELIDGDHHFMMSNLRLATGAPDTRNKILQQNKWVTHGIQFDVNSDRIKPESYGTLKEMATVLKENPDLRVKIVGHTDADGDDAFNLDLSLRRAKSVRAALVKEFEIAESRLEAEGKGETVPIDNNTTPVGKANNRRVEFIKI